MGAGDGERGPGRGTGRRGRAAAALDALRFCSDTFSIGLANKFMRVLSFYLCSLSVLISLNYFKLFDIL